MTRPPSSH